MSGTVVSKVTKGKECDSVFMDLSLRKRQYSVPRCGKSETVSRSIQPSFKGQRSLESEETSRRSRYLNGILKKR